MYVLLFDIDGTLIHSGGAGRDALDEALSLTFSKLGADAVEIHGCTDRGIARSLFQLHGLEDNEENWMRFRDAYLSVLPRRLQARAGHVLPGVLAMMEQLSRRHDVALGLLTGNIREGARLKLEHYQLHHHFAFGGYGDLHHQRDDVAREALQAAIDHLRVDVPGDRVWVIGDTPNDVRCARSIGARVAAIATGGFTAEELQVHRPDLLLADLDQGASLLELLA